MLHPESFCAVDSDMLAGIAQMVLVSEVRRVRAARGRGSGLAHQAAWLRLHQRPCLHGCYLLLTCTPAEVLSSQYMSIGQ